MSGNEYTPQFSLLHDCHSQMVKAVQDTAILQRVRGSAAHYWPSSASIQYSVTKHGKTVVETAGSCLRQVYYNAKGYLPTETSAAGMHDIWALGNAAEDIYKQRFEALEGYRLMFPNILGEKLKFSNDKTKLRGEVDIVLQHKETGIIIGVEMKSYVGFYAAMEVAGYEAAKAAYKSQSPYIKVNDPKRKAKPFPKLTNLLQVMLYLDQFKDSINMFKLIYVSRDKGPSAEFDIELANYEGKTCAQVNGVIITWLHLEGIFARYDELGENIRNETVPPRDFVPEYDPDEILDEVEKGHLPKWIGNKVKGGTIHRDWQCEFCPHLSTCLAESSDDVPF